MQHLKEMEYIKDELSTRALLEGLAEECNELGQAALKLIRAISGENPTPVSMGEAGAKLREEAGDVLAYMNLLDLGVNDEMVMENEKWTRWAERIREERGY